MLTSKIVSFQGVAKKAHLHRNKCKREPRMKKVKIIQPIYCISLKQH